MSNFSAYCFPFTRGQEGGFQRITSDGGNWTGGRPGRGQLIGTNIGISAPTLADWLGRIPTVAEMEELSPETAAAIYERDFATPLSVEQLSPAAALMLFDCSVQHGVAGTVRIAQGVVGAQADGVFGPKSLAAVQAYGDGFIVAMDASFLAMLKRLGAEWTEFGEEWQRRADERLAAANGLLHVAQVAGASV
jgi:lysozyme family protein